MSAAQLIARESGTFEIGGDLPVHRLGFGAMRITGEGIWGEPEDRDEALRVLRRAVELGITFIDTADSYGPGVSEELIREALAPYPDDLVIATKGGLVRGGPGTWNALGRPDYLRQALELSLRRLGVDSIDLYQLHRIDSGVPLEEQIGVLGELRQEGKIRHLGLSEVTVEEIEAARATAPITTVQNLYNLANRKAEPVVDYCEREGLGFVPWFPIATGSLAKPGGVLDTLATEIGAAPPQLALAWLLERSPVMLPIPGTSKVAHLEENTAAAGVHLSEEQFAAIAAAAKAAV
jgi:aryl-alcohol dehydrogenase-like predicted oxidoreductase